MNTKIINGILIGAIVLVVAGMGFFAWRMFSGGAAPFLGQQKPGTEEQVLPEPSPITNKGKESEDRDATLERDVRAISDAALAYAKDHAGIYPESDFKNPCSGTQYCLKGVDINTKDTMYLPVIPQTPIHLLDYHYRADNQKKSYCITTPSVLETDTGKMFQCTETACGRVPVAERCQ